jgi:hypothetical protein
LAAEFNPLVEQYYAAHDLRYPEAARRARPLLTVQGGIAPPASSAA